MTTKTESEPDTISAVVSRELGKMVRAIADRRDMTMIEVWNQYARPAILREYKRVVAEMHTELGGEGG